MPPEANQRSRHRLWWVLCAALPVLYVLSYGLMLFVDVKLYLAPEVGWERPDLPFYAPLKCLAGTPLELPLKAYENWWIDLALPRRNS